MFEALDNLFDLNGDGNLDLGEQALEYDVIFNDDIISDDLDSDFDFIDDFEDTDEDIFVDEDKQEAATEKEALQPSEDGEADDKLDIEEVE